MFVVKRNGNKEPANFNKILKRIQKLTKGLDKKFVEPVKIAQGVISRMYDGISTKELDSLASREAHNYGLQHPDYLILAGRLEASSLQKEISFSFSETIKKNPEIFSEAYKNFVSENALQLDLMIDHTKDFNFEYMGIRTLIESYLIKDKNQNVIETPQYLYLRVATAIWMRSEDALTKIKNYYEILSDGKVSHATPTLFNAGTVAQQLSSCFLSEVHDSLEDIFTHLKQNAHISKYSGGLGVSFQKIRSQGSKIHSTGGKSNGLIPFLRIYNEMVRSIDQGGGKRKGSLAAYLEPWHPDITDFLDLRKNQGAEERRCRDLFTALWIPDLFMRRIENDENWSLFDPAETPDLNDLYDETETGGSFTTAYENYEKQGKAQKTIKARDLWFLVMQSCFETGTPYLCFKDQANRNSSQKNCGVIHSSNLCTEIMEVTSKDETSVCNLAAIPLHTHIKNGAFDFLSLRETVHQAIEALDNVIDINFYPIEETKITNLHYRPLGLGVLALADLLASLKLSWDSEEAKKLNQKILATMYLSALEKTIELAKTKGKCEANIVRDYLHFDYYGISDEEVSQLIPSEISVSQIREDLKKHGMRNSLLIALMPTATTAQILGANECFEPFTELLYKRKVLSGEFTLLNKYLVRDLVDLELWSKDLSTKIIFNNGSIQSLIEIPESLKERYKTVWEIGTKTLIDYASLRAPFVDQSQSFNLWMKDPNPSAFTKAIFYGWKNQIKTGMYYLRRDTKAKAQKNLGVSSIEKNEEPQICSIDNPDCTSCSV